MSGRDLAQRLAITLIRRACLHLPDGARDEWQREWAAELPAILDDPAVHSRIRRYIRAVRFAAGQRQAVRCMTHPTWPQWLGMTTIRAAAFAAVAAVALTVAALALSPAADHAPSDSSPIAVADIALFLLAVLAGLICTTLLVGLALVRAIRWLWHRPRRLADVPAGSGDRWARAGRSSAVRRRPRITGLTRSRLGTARAAAVAFLAAVISFTVALVAGTISEQPFAGSFLLSLLADTLRVTGLVCLAFLAIRALTGAGGWLWHLVHHGPRTLPGRRSRQGRQAR